MGVNLVLTPIIAETVRWEQRGLLYYQVAQPDHLYAVALRYTLYKWPVSKALAGAAFNRKKNKGN